MTHSVPTDLDDTVLTTWFERDRAHVRLARKDRDGEAGETIVEWWDEAVGEAVEDGFLNPKDWHGTAFEYAGEHGLLAAVEVDLDRLRPSLTMAFVRATPAGERPCEQPDRLEWLAEAAAETAESALQDPQFASLSPGQSERLAAMLAGELYEAAVHAESRPRPLRLKTAAGTAVLDMVGERLVLRGGGADGTIALSGGRRANFAMAWRPADGPGEADLVALFAAAADGPLKSDGRAARGLRRLLAAAIEESSEEIADFLAAHKEWQAMIELEGAVERNAGIAGEAVRPLGRAYDRARVARAAARLHATEELHAPAPAM